MLSIKLFLLGYVWDFDLKSVARLLGYSKNTISVSVNDPIRNIGEPDLYGMGYSHSRLFKLFPLTDRNTFCVGVTAAPIEDNYFAIYQKPNSILVTLYQADEFCEKSGKTKEEYVAYIILSQLLWAQYKLQIPSASYNDLFHEATRGCLFDFCSNKSDIVVGLRICQIDPMCKGELIKANIPESLVNEVEGIMNRMRTPNFFKTFQMGLQTPFFSFVLGGLVLGLVINLFSSLVLGEFNSLTDYYVMIALLLLVVLLVSGNYFKYVIASKRAKM